MPMCRPVGRTGKVIVDENGDRAPVFWVMQYKPDMEHFQPYGYVGIEKKNGKVTYNQLKNPNIKFT